MATRAIVMQLKTQRPAEFEVTAATREALQAWIKQAALKSDDFLFPSRIHDRPMWGPRSSDLCHRAYENRLAPRHRPLPPPWT